MNPNYASPGPDMLACPACDTNVLGSPVPVALSIHQAQVVRLLHLGDVVLRLDGKLPAQLEALLAAGDYDVLPEAALQLAGKLVCPACGHHSDWQLQRRAEDLLYSRYRLQHIDAADAPTTGLPIMMQDLHALQVFVPTLLPDAEPKDLSRLTSLETLFAGMEVQSLRYLIDAYQEPLYSHFYAQALVPLPAEH